jgi:phosphoesterase RecJ-like protein
MIENESDGKIKMSFRSQGAFSVNDFARTYFSGGGHHNAAGGMSMDNMEKTIDRFKKAVSEVSDQFQQ